MKIQLPPAPAGYDERDQNALRRLLTDALFKLLERNGEIEIGPRSGRLVIVDEVTGTRYRAKMASGVFTWEAL